jgi:hypothetical protein
MAIRLHSRSSDLVSVGVGGVEALLPCDSGTLWFRRRRMIYWRFDFTACSVLEEVQS